MNADRRSATSKRRQSVCAVALAVVFALGATAEARPQPWALQAEMPVDPHELPEGRIVQGGQRVSLQEAIAIAQRRYNGRVASAETTTSGGRAVHVIRILGDDSRVRTVRIDAESGRELR